MSASKQRIMAVLLWIGGRRRREQKKRPCVANKKQRRIEKGRLKPPKWHCDALVSVGSEYLANLFWNCCIKLTTPILTTQSGTMSQPTSKEESNLCHPPSKIWRFSSVNLKVDSAKIFALLSYPLCKILWCSSDPCLKLWRQVPKNPHHLSSRRFHLELQESKPPQLNLKPPNY